MANCPHCQQPVAAGQHFCSQCGADLSTAPVQENVCPRCGSRVQSEQKFCAECGHPLRPGAAPPAAATGRWLIALGAAAVIVLVLLVLVINLTRKPARPPEPQAAAPPPAAALPPAVAPAPAATPAPTSPTPAKASLEIALEEVLQDIRQANLDKDIVLYMSRYSTLYPELDKKREDTLSTWEKNDFKNLAFNLSKIRALGENDAVAEVSWSILVYNKAKKKAETSDYTYQVWFSRELGRWKIKKIEDLSS